MSVKHKVVQYWVGAKATDRGTVIDCPDFEGMEGHVCGGKYADATIHIINSYVSELCERNKQLPKNNDVAYLAKNNKDMNLWVRVNVHMNEYMDASNVKSKMIPPYLVDNKTSWNPGE